MFAEVKSQERVSQRAGLKHLLAQLNSYPLDGSLPWTADSFGGNEGQASAIVKALCDDLRHARELATNPAEWMPWNYRETLKAAGV